MERISRAEFNKLILASFTIPLVSKISKLLALDFADYCLKDEEREIKYKVNTPPSLMLHSASLNQVEEIVPFLKERHNFLSYHSFYQMLVSNSDCSLSFSKKTSCYCFCRRLESCLYESKFL